MTSLVHDLNIFRNSFTLALFVIVSGRSLHFLIAWKANRCWPHWHLDCGRRIFFFCLEFCLWVSLTWIKSKLQSVKPWMHLKINKTPSRSLRGIHWTKQGTHSGCKSKCWLLLIFRMMMMMMMMKPLFKCHKRILVHYSTNWGH